MISKMAQQYLDHSRKIISSPRSNFKRGSKGTGLISLFGHQNEYDLRKGLPLITTKKMFPEGVIHELIWFMKGDTNIKYLEDNRVNIWRRDAFQHNLQSMAEEGIFSSELKKYSPEWDSALEEYGQRIVEDDEFAARFGDAGPIYGKQWRKWEYFDKEQGKLVEIDQLTRMVETLINKPMSKKNFLTAWQPGDVGKMSLEPCHATFQATSDGEGNLELQLYQRSCDQFLGVPYNIASYAMLTQIIAQQAGMIPKTFIHTFGDSHFYTGLEKRSEWYGKNFQELQNSIRAVSDIKENLEVLDWINQNAPKDSNEEKYDHVTAILKQLSRTPKPHPKIEIADKTFDKLEFSDFKITDYEHHAPIKRLMAV
jgi:thymidylate synthase